MSDRGRGAVVPARLGFVHYGRHPCGGARHVDQCTTHVLEGAGPEAPKKSVSNGGMGGEGHVYFRRGWGGGKSWGPGAFALEGRVWGCRCGSGRGTLTHS